MRRALLYLWTLPTTTVGFPFLLLAPFTRGQARLVQGVLELHGPAVSFFLKHFARNASAMTLGHIVLGRDADALHWSRPHERIHVQQCQRWGPFFLPAYAAASFHAFLRGRHPYWDNPFERQAYREAP